MKNHEVYKIAEVYELSNRTQMTLMALVSFSNRKTNTCYPSIAKIAKRANLSERSVQYGIAELTSKAIIDKVTQYRSGGGNRSNLYIIKPPELPNEPRRCTPEGANTAPCTQAAKLYNYCNQPASKSAQLVHNEPILDLTDAREACNATELDGSAFSFSEVTTQTETAAVPAEPQNTSETFRAISNSKILNEEGFTEINPIGSTQAFSGKSERTEAVQPEKKNGERGGSAQTEHIAARYFANLAATRYDEPGFKELLHRCGADMQDAPQLLTAALERLYYGRELRLSAAVLPREVFFPRLRLLNRFIVEAALKRFRTKARGTVIDPIAYLAAVLYNSVAEDSPANPVPRRSGYGNRKFSAPMTAVPDAAELLRLEQLLARQSAKI